MKTKTIHAKRNGTKRPLCEKRQGKTTDVASEVTCLGCGKAALRAVKAAAAAADSSATAAPDAPEARQLNALARMQAPRWWEGETDG